MFFLDVSNIFTLILLLIATVLLIFLSQELKKSYISGIALFFYLILLAVHVGQLIPLSQENASYLSELIKCAIIDLVFVFITFFAYLWVDDIEAKKLGKKSVDDSLQWFWKNV